MEFDKSRARKKLVKFPWPPEARDVDLRPTHAEPPAEAPEPGDSEELPIPKDPQE